MLHARSGLQGLINMNTFISFSALKWNNIQSPHGITLKYDKKI